MSITAYCTAANIETLLSQFGVDSRADDDLDGSADDGIVDAAIEKASADVNLYLLARYSVADVAASAWVKWVTATFAVAGLSKRRGNPCPESISEQCEQYVEELKRIQDGKQPLIGDSGPVAPRYEDLPTVSNLIVDGRYRRSKIRRIPATSTGAPPAGGRTQHNTVDFGFNQ